MGRLIDGLGKAMVLTNLKFEFFNKSIVCACMVNDYFRQFIYTKEEGTFDAPSVCEN